MKTRIFLLLAAAVCAGLLGGCGTSVSGSTAPTEASSVLESQAETDSEGLPQ